MTSTIPLWLVVFAVGLTVAAIASRRAVDAAIMASDATNISPGLIGLTVMAVGTDLPEIANSIISSLTGHGDVNVGDSAGSAMTQVTLVLAVLCFHHNYPVATTGNRRCWADGCRCSSRCCVGCPR